MKPSLEKLIENLEIKFGKLTPQAEHCALDFHENYDEFISSIILDKILIYSSPNMLADKLKEPKYKRYRTYGSLSILMIIVGFAVIFFNWKVSMGIFFISFVLKFFSNYEKNKISKEFSERIKAKFNKNCDEAMFDVCQFYIAGILLLSSSKGNAHLPLLPSYSITGIEKFARIR